MSSNTTNLNLYKANPITDGENTFNIDTLLNENWDKIDSNVAKKSEIPTIPTALPANGGNSTTVNNHTAAATANTTEKTDLIGMTNEVKNEVDTHLADYAYQIPIVTPVTGGTQIKINRLSNTNRLFFKLDVDLTGGPISISTDGGINFNALKDIEGHALTSLEKGFVEVVADATFFTLRNRGISSAQKQQLIDITNAAEANQSTIKTNIVTGLNTGTGSSLTSSSSWIDIQNVINNIKNRKNGTATSDSSGFITVTGLGFKPSIVIVKNPTYNGQIGKDWSFYFSSSSYISSSDEFFRIDSSSSVYSVTGDSINNNGFTLKVSSNSTNYKWIAFE